MQNLIVGERYKVKHRQGNWEGEVTFEGYEPEDLFGEALMRIKDVVITGGTNRVFVTEYYRKKGGKTSLGSTPEWWGFEPVNFTLENE